MKSNGGVMGVPAATRQAIHTALSGRRRGSPAPRGWRAKRASRTSSPSTSVGPARTSVWCGAASQISTGEGKIGDFPLQLPMIDIHTIGAGGGSIAYVASGGRLTVGPRSAGAVLARPVTARRG